MSKKKQLDDMFGVGNLLDTGSTKSFGSGSLDYGSYGSGSKNWMTGSGRCYEKHPPLKLPNSELVIYGGSCISPVVDDADVYIGFDRGMKQTWRAWPWKKGTEFLFEITDMQAPKNAEEFGKLVDWTLKQLQDGKKVHCGCIGGHGRTGTFLAALVARCGEPDAIEYVRKNYCQKAVESTAQIDFLAKHFGVKPAKGSKPYGSTKGHSGSKLSLAKKTFEPVKSSASIWG